MNSPESLPQPSSELTKNVTPLTEEEQAKRGWKLTVNGTEVPGVSSAKLTQEKMNIVVEYGKTPEGYDGITIEEAGGGGSVIIPSVVIDGQLYIGVVEENRPKAGGKQFNVPRGFLDPGETHFAAAKRELAEESGYTPMEDRIQDIGGEPMNPNSTFFVTKGSDKGVKPFAVQVRQDEVRKVQSENDNPIDRVYEFNPDVIQGVTPAGKKVMNSKFIHWTKAMGLKDMFTVAAVGRLVTAQIASREANTASGTR